MTIRDAHILITGGAGFIGSHLARACVREGATVACILRPGTNPWRLLEALPSVTRIEANLEDERAVASSVAKFHPTVIFHLASVINRKRDISLYPELHDAHVGVTRHLVTAALNLPTSPRFIHTGTIEEYGRGPVPYREEQRELPVTPYSLTKQESVQLVLYAAREHGLSASVIRPSLTYGPMKGIGMFIPDFIRSAMTTKIFKMSAGEQTRDFLYVDDAVRAYIAVATADGVEGEIFNVATGVETKLKDVAEKLRAHFNGDVTVEYGAFPTDPRVETMRCFMSINKITERLSWRPLVSLEEGLAKTVAWHRVASDAYATELWGELSTG
jgi:nucleoside-diphosphate-sugar epimerase